MERRRFLQHGLLALGATALPARAAQVAPPIKALAFDGFPIFDPRPVDAQVRADWPAQGAALSAEWRRRLFEYTWLRTASGHYAAFDAVAAEALDYAVEALQVPVTAAQKQRWLQIYHQLPTWPEVPAVLQRCRKLGIRLAFLSNLTEAMLADCLDRAGLREAFEFLLSTDRVQAYKPSPRAYEMAPAAFGLQREEIAFVASAGWDAAGAKWFGYPTLWIQRQAQPNERLGVQADVAATDLGALLPFINARPTS